MLKKTSSNSKFNLQSNHQQHWIRADSVWLGLHPLSNQSILHADRSKPSQLADKHQSGI